ncbi:MAG: hypothetical protein RIQ60_2170 [Pseudomonadota bacterium]|jgi:uncharacterized protein involved in exopolysaccharide biosynthesis
MDLLILFGALRARWKLFTSVLVLVLSAAVVACVLLPRSYRATATLLVSGPQGAGAVPDRSAFLQTQADMLASDNVARRVVELQQLVRQPGAQAAWAKQRQAGRPGDTGFEDWAVQQWLTRPRIEVGQGGLVRLSIDDTSPVAAATVANAYTRAYRELVNELQMQVTQRTQTLLDQRLAVLRQELDQAQARLIDYQRRHGIVSIDAAADPAQARLSDLTAQLARAREQQLDQLGRLTPSTATAGLGVRDAGANAVAPSSLSAIQALREVQADVQVQRLNAEVQQGQARLQALSLQYGSAHPAVLEQQAENERRQTSLQTQVRTLLAGMDQQAAHNRWRTAALQAQLAAERADLIAGQSRRGELALLANRLDSAQRTYDTAMQRFVIDMVSGQVFHAELGVLSPAVAPLRPRSPRLASLLGGGLLLGLLLGGGAVAMAESHDRRIRCRADLQHLLQQLGGPVPPLLGLACHWHPAASVPASRWLAKRTATPHMPVAADPQPVTRHDPVVHLG